MSKEDKKKSRIITFVALAQMIVALAILVAGVLHKSITTMQGNLIMGGTLLIYWILMDIADPVLTHRFEGITQAQREAYPKYVLFDFVGYAGIAYFLLGMGSNQSGSIIGALIYAVTVKPKQENQKIFLGKEAPKQESEDGEETEEDTEKENLIEETASGGEENTQE